MATSFETLTKSNPDTDLQIFNSATQLFANLAFLLINFSQIFGNLYLERI